MLQQPGHHLRRQKTPLVETVLGVRAILPLVLFLMFVLFVVLKSTLPNKMVTVYGLALSIIGMCIFNVGLTYGLGAIGTQTGGVLPAAFMELPISESSPIFSKVIGLGVVIGFAFLLGFGATLAEPALNALGLTVQDLTNGAFKKSMLMYSVAGGVAVGIALGVAKLVLNFDLMKVLLPLYAIGILLTVFSTEEFVNVAWDSAGVTTGPVTVPLVLAMGLGLGSAVSAVEGFGILSLASICPIVAVLSMGIFIRLQHRFSAQPATGNVMEERTITYLTDACLITCILQKDLAEGVLEAAKNHKVQQSDAIGTGVRERMGLLGMAIDEQKEVIRIIVSKEQSELIFETMYLAGQLDKPGKGIMFMSNLDRVATFIPDEVMNKFA